MNDILFHQSVCILVLKHLIVLSLFIWVDLEIKFDLQMCF